MEEFIPGAENQDKYKASDYSNGALTLGYYLNEEFRIFPLNPRYLVSNYGNVYDRVTQMKIYPVSLPEGYLRCRLEDAMMLVHRMVAITFLTDTSDPYYGQLVHHKDEVKYHNKLDNLMWTDYQNNVLYSLSDDVNRDHIFNFPLEMKHAICQMLEDPNISSKQVAEKFGVPYDRRWIVLISNIRNGTAWKDIAKNYHIVSVNKNAEKYKTIHTICQCLTQGMESPDIAKIVGVPYNMNFAALVSDIRTGKRWKSISKDYDISGYTWDGSTVDRICQMMVAGRDSMQIANALGVPYDKKFITSLSFIRTGRTFKNITKNYPELYRGFTEKGNNNLRL